MTDAAAGTPGPGRMRAEIAEIPAMAARQVDAALPLWLDAGRRLRRRQPPLLLTCGRGSSAHALLFLKYLTETRLGIPVAGMGPSVASVYAARIRAPGTACISVSQSGAGPDIAAFQAAARAGGARAIALVNAPDSPLAGGADVALPMLAGPERAIAATKSMVASLVALAALHAGMAADRELEAAIRRLPEDLAAALDRDWPAASLLPARGAPVYVLGRGPGLAAACEAALKLKETCRLHAEAFSAAESLHGPLALADGRLTVLAFVPGDRAAARVREVADRFAACGARVLLAATGDPDRPLSVAPVGHPALVPISQVTSLFRFVHAVAECLGHDPDRPRHLVKIIRTT